MKENGPILNKSNGKPLVRGYKQCRSILSQARGLMFSRKITDSALVFEFGSEKICSLHMFFVFFPIDVLFVDTKKRVVEMKRHFKPFTLYWPRHKARYILELPDGSIDRSGCKVGSRLGF